MSCVTIEGDNGSATACTPCGESVPLSSLHTTMHGVVVSRAICEGERCVRSAGCESGSKCVATVPPDGTSQAPGRCRRV